MTEKPEDKKKITIEIETTVDIVKRDTRSEGRAFDNIPPERKENQV